jgi:hypothetical protein
LVNTVLGGSMPRTPALVADNIDTLILNVKLRQDLPLELAQQLDILKEASRDAEIHVEQYILESLWSRPHSR